MEDAQWTQKIVRFNPGDVLVLYTDGITEAQNPQEEYFGEHRLMDIVRSKSTSPSNVILNAILSEVYRFVGDTPRQDDIALVVIRRQ